jgi:hypothetical protein
MIILGQNVNKSLKEIAVEELQKRFPESPDTDWDTLGEELIRREEFHKFCEIISTQNPISDEPINADISELQTWWEAFVDWIKDLFNIKEESAGEILSKVLNSVKNTAKESGSAIYDMERNCKSTRMAACIYRGCGCDRDEKYMYRKYLRALVSGLVGKNQYSEMSHQIIGIFISEVIRCGIDMNRICEDISNDIYDIIVESHLPEILGMTDEEVRANARELATIICFGIAIYNFLIGFESVEALQNTLHPQLQNELQPQSKSENEIIDEDERDPGFVIDGLEV